MLTLLTAAYLAAGVPCIVAPLEGRREGAFYCTERAAAGDWEKASPPGVTIGMRNAGTASATRAPWVDSNGSEFLRKPSGKYLYELPKGKAALAAAEAFVFGVEARLKIAPEDQKPAEEMLAFLRSVPAGQGLKPAVNIAVIDNGSAAIPEVVNLMIRRNLLCRVTKTADPGVDLRVRIGSGEFPEAEAADPTAVADKVRQKLTDRKRLLRIYGSEVVIGRVEQGAGRARIHLLNYSSNSAFGVRVRLRGAYSEIRLYAFGVAGNPEEVVRLADATEFTIPEMGAYAYIDLERSK